jgi:hypothetical protein
MWRAPTRAREDGTDRPGRGAASPSYHDPDP